MRKHKVMTAALALALVLCAVVVMTASAAPPAPGKMQVNAKPATVKYVGQTQFGASPKAPAKNGPDTPQLATNRAIPSKTRKAKAATDQYQFPTVLPTKVDSNTVDHLMAGKGVNAYDSWQAQGTVYQPPDQGLCAGNGYILEMVNMVAAIYDGNLHKITGNMSLDSFFGLPHLGSTGDPRCYYDPGSQRFFATQISAGGPDSGDYGPNALTHYFLMIAVSQTSDPRLGWYLYSLDTTFDCVAGYPCLPDMPLIGGNRDAFFISTNAYEDSAPYNFDGANFYVLDKTALIAGSFNNLVNAAYIPIGQTVPTPDPGGIWYTIQPSFAASTGDWDNRMGGTEYMLSSLEFFGTGDNRIALWALTNTQSIHGAPASFLFWLNWDIVPSQFYNSPEAFSGQADDGIYDYGYWYYSASHVGPIQPNDDRMNQVFQGPKHTLWSGLNTGLWQRFKGKPPTGSIAPAGGFYYTEYHNGIAYFGITPKWDKQGNLLYDWVTQGYVAPAHEDALFPAIAMAADGHGAMTFTLTSGPVYYDDAGSPQYYGVARYPSAAYTQMNTRGAGDVFVSHAGMGSYDGSCEYNPACGGGVLRPRWGDYSAAVVMNNYVYFATEYIQYPECSRDYYNTVDNTCGDTRAYRQNWGTSLARTLP